jgi:alkanesulfonate monooxygenase SsuD/methylene tetrahydromethanopterin reductase-like flavin-dependent oxidoreductase (luciferase family)
LRLKIDVFCEVETANTSGPGHEYRLIKETLAQAEAADAAGFDCWWQVEHHGAVAMSYSSAPDVILSAIAQRTKRIRIGHSAVLAPHKFSHPIRIAERAATLDLVSDGRLEVGFARSTIPEWRLFEIDPDSTRAQLEKTMRMVPKMWTQDAFSWDDDSFHIKNAPIIPKPLQKPHPPLWQAASSPESFVMAGHNGVGALGTTLLTPVDVIAALLGSYRDAIKDADPAGAFINNQAGVFTFVHCAQTTKQAIENGAAEAAAWYVNTIVKFFELEQALQRRTEAAEPADRAGAGLVGDIQAPARPEAAPPSPDNAAAIALVNRLAHGDTISGEEVYEILNKQDSVIIGDPATCKQKMKRYRDVGVDRLLCFQQVGGLSHEAILDSTRLVGQHLIPFFSPK